MIAAIVAGTALGALASVLIGQAHVSDLDREVELAFRAVKNALEEARATPVSRLYELDGAGFAIDSIEEGRGGLASLDNDADKLPGSLSVTLVEQDGDHVIYRVTARADWKGKTRARSFALESLVSRRYR